MLILITANRAACAALKAPNTRRCASDKSSSLDFPPLLLPPVLPPSVAPSVTVIWLRNFARQVIKEQSREARPGAAAASAVDNRRAVSPLFLFTPQNKTEEKPKQSRGEPLFVLESVSLPLHYFSKLNTFFFSRRGKWGCFFPSFWQWSMLPRLPSPSAHCVAADLRSSVTVNYATLETDDQQELWNRESTHGGD